MSEKKELPPDRYYTPQVQSSVSHKPPSIYQPTPKPESVIVHEKTRVHKNNSCCISCLLACFICLAVKDEGTKTAEQ
ncbi:hypothetical protein CU097_015766 [Rhizopus azygosporus]|uniref:Cysteine-rich transmembrane CYSTM domain-containing protein n=1 Tax=Rhizopus azygosporus TaxID=86630 RepID=A0A367KFM5_RHIAZ|nr:hypothetical protein CU097_015766 [Rhizopus azygosporus]